MTTLTSTSGRYTVARHKGNRVRLFDHLKAKMGPWVRVPEIRFLFDSTQWDAAMVRLTKSLTEVGNAAVAAATSVTEAFENIPAPDPFAAPSMSMLKQDLIEMANSEGITVGSKWTKADLIDAITEARKPLDDDL